MPSKSEHGGLLTVGAVQFVAQNPLPADLSSYGHDADYTQFLLTGPGDSAGSILVDFLCGDFPGLPDQECLFRGSESWAAYRSGGGYILASASPGREAPAWVASTTRDFADITIHVGGSGRPGPAGNVYFNPLRYPLDQILLMHYLGTRNGLIVHSAGLLCNEKSYIFPGISGAGKTTLSECLGGSARFHLLSDDRMIIREMDSSIRAYGTPWPGDGKIAVNGNGKLGGIFFLNKSPENRAQELTPQEAFHRLMPVVSIPWYNRDIVGSSLGFCERLVSETPAYDLFFHPSPDLSPFLAEMLG